MSLSRNQKISRNGLFIGISIIILSNLFCWLYFGYLKKVWAGERAEIVNEIGKPYAVLTIDYGEPPEGFIEGEFYVLKVLRIRATKIDYGFCPVKRETFYPTRNNADVD